jgi:hypothetical protein
VKTNRLCYSFFVVTRPVIDIDRSLTDAARWGLLQKKAQEVRSVQAFKLFREKGIEPILIKGLAAAMLYPAHIPRISIDLDLAVSPDEFAAAKAIAVSTAAHGLAIDLHCGLRHLDTVEWSDLFENSHPVELDGGTIRILRPEDHLRVLCVHWLTDGGVYQDRLWDIYYSVENRGTDFDWDRFLGIVSERRRRWLVCTLGLAQYYLRLDLTATPIEVEARDLPRWLVTTVEREWASETKPRPLEASMHDPVMFAKQVKRRMRPNPIWATVQMNGSFDARTRVHYQLANVFNRIPPSYRRISNTLRLRNKK